MRAVRAYWPVPLGAAGSAVVPLSLCPCQLGTNRRLRDSPTFRLSPLAGGLGHHSPETHATPLRSVMPESFPERSCSFGA